MYSCSSLIKLKYCNWCNSTGAHYGPTNVRQKSITYSLISNLIVSCGLPVSIVDHPAFRAFLADIDPKYVPPVRQTVTNSLLPQLLQSQQTKLTTLLQQCSDVSLTCDIWTDRRMHSFLGVTAHVFVSGHPASYLLAFRSLTGSHTGQRIAQALESVITECGLQNKIRCIVTDNASNMKKLCRWCLRYMMIVSQPMVRLMILQYGKMRR